MTVDAIAWIIGAYLVGGIPFGVLIGKIKGVDPRTVGSKNIGATNVMRALGPGFGLLVLLLDMLKGFLPTYLALRYYTVAHPGYIETYSLTTVGWWVVFLAAVAAMVGHIFPIWLGFKGGKGVATAGGVIFALDPRVGLAALATFIIVLAVTRYVSVASTAAAVAIPVSGWLLLRQVDWHASLFRPDIVTIFGVLAVLFVVYKHRANYQRLRLGTEPKFGEKK